MKRFWDKVDVQGPDDCWECQGSLNNKGYGGFKLGKKTETAHRASYLLNAGEIPDGIVVRHKCDNRCCVNPNHLELGTYSENNQDIVNRNRRRYKLTIDQVRTIRKRLASGAVGRHLADEYGVSFGLISHIKNDRTWTEGWRTA